MESENITTRSDVALVAASVLLIIVLAGGVAFGLISPAKPPVLASYSSLPSASSGSSSTASQGPRVAYIQNVIQAAYEPLAMQAVVDGQGLSAAEAGSAVGALIFVAADDAGRLYWLLVVLWPDQSFRTFMVDVTTDPPSVDYSYEYTNALFTWEDTLGAWRQVR